MRSLAVVCSLLLICKTSAQGSVECDDFDYCVMEHGFDHCEKWFGGFGDDHPCMRPPSSSPGPDSTTTTTTRGPSGDRDLGGGSGTAGGTQNAGNTIGDINLQLDDQTQGELFQGDILIEQATKNDVSGAGLSVDPKTALDEYLGQRNGLFDNIEKTAKLLEAGHFDASGSQEIANKLQLAAVRDRRFKWPGGVVYYDFAYGHFTRSEQWQIVRAMQGIMDKTCVKFQPKSWSTRHYINIINGGGCYSLAGMAFHQTFGGQRLSLGKPKCMKHHIIQHELMHALGFFHEQGRNDRDDYINIHWENMPSDPRARAQFDKFSLREIDHLGFEYEYGSVMHYPANLVSRNGRPTMSSKRGNHELGNSIGITDRDAARINCYYRCPKGCNIGGGGGGGGGGTTTGPIGGCRNSDFSKLCLRLKPFCNVWPGTDFQTFMHTTCKKTCKGCN